MLRLCLLLLTTNVLTQKVIESTEDLPPEAFNTTVLHPVTNKTDEEPKQNTATSWRIETTFAKSNSKIEDNNSTESKEKQVEKPRNESKEFKPSPHLGSFVDVDSIELTPTKETLGSFTPVIKKPPTGFLSSPKTKYPKDVFKNYHEFPYKFENAILTRTKDRWKPANPTMEPTPTAEVPVRVPAGGLYKWPDAFKEKPGFSGDDEDFGLEFSEDVKENSVRKRGNPWKNLLHLITALIPVGLIFSALTPSIITIENTDNQIPQHKGILRRSATEVSQLPPISERCRRRLLCELHSDRNYAAPPSSAPKRARQCHRIRCEDPEALARTLSWLLTYPYHQPAPDHLEHLT